MREGRLDILLAYRGWMDADVSCPGCELTTDANRHRAVDAIVFHIPTTPLRIPFPKLPGQTWVAWSMESDSNYPRLGRAGFMSQFDLTVTYRQDADVVARYCQAADWLPFEPPPLIAHPARETAPAVYLASSHVDRSGRTEYVRELMRHIPVDSYGRELNNRSLANDQGPKTKLETIARYHFTLAFENSISVDYVTEKLYEPLRVGSVPVYLGAPNVAEHVPAADCYIDVRDFAGPAELARHLTDLVADEQRYAQLLEWRKRPLDSRFLEHAREQRIPAMCRLCGLLRERHPR
jgi:Glycosyltransferase family 10 (fucosyltransferase) C-term/Fucosyltransferase, N-terminal